MNVDVIRRKPSVLEIVLDRPKALNALTSFMLSAIHEALTVAEMDSAVEMVVIRSSSNRAFCAGGDVKEFYDCGIENAHILHVFATQEYELSRRIYHFEKPIVTIAAGILMGGGVALSLTARYLVGTETTLFAMPEVAIGYFPDAGSTYYLSRLPKKVGLFLAMTGEAIRAKDLQRIGLIQHFIPNEKIEDFIDALPTSFKEFPVDLGEPMLDFDQIEKAFSQKSVGEIITSFGEEHFAKKSPSSIEIAFAQMEVAKKMSFDQVIDLDIAIAKEVLKMSDVYEGVRAKLIDKDNEPSWQKSKDLNVILTVIRKDLM